MLINTSHISISSPLRRGFILFFHNFKKDKNLYVFTSFTIFPLRCSCGNFKWGDNCSIYTLPLFKVKPINITNRKTNFPSTKWMKDWLAMGEYIVLVH